MPTEEPSTSVPGLGGVVAIPRSSMGTPAVPSGAGGGTGPTHPKDPKPKKVKTPLQQAQTKVKEIHSKVGDLRTMLAKIQMTGPDDL